MLAQQTTLASHAGEAQASNLIDPRSAHWENLAVELLLAAKTLANEHLQGQCDDIRACASASHHQAVRNLFAAIKNADSAGLSDACAALAASAGAEPLQLWSVTNDDFSAGSLSDLIKASDWLRPGDVVYQAQTTGRYTLTEADFVAAAPVRDPRVSDMFSEGGAA